MNNILIKHLNQNKMEEGFEIKIKVGKTKTITVKNQEYSVTDYWFNGGEKREAVITPARYATDIEVWTVIAKDIEKTFKSE